VLLPLTVRKGFGPEFQEAGSWVYRAEYGALCVAIVGYVIWRAFFAGGIDALQVILWAIFPDLVAFVPIGLSSKRQEWPSWGAYLYNAVHNVITWALVFVAIWAAVGNPSWPTFGWLGHIALDRTIGYDLRKSPQES
jgi:hypothetical protein